MAYICYDCKMPIDTPKHGGAGYGHDNTGHRICYACCGLRDARQMRETGKAVLYLVERENRAGGASYRSYHVTNWPGTLDRPVKARRVGRHNIAGKRYDVWFTFEGAEWHGVTYGDNTQLCHCKRIGG